VHLINEKPRGRPKEEAERLKGGEEEGVLMNCSSVAILAFFKYLRAYKL